MNVALISERVTSQTPPTQRPTWRSDAVAVGVLAVVVSAAGASRPSLWFDEAATIAASANRSLPELWRVLGRVDAVHGLYYLLMHGWFAVFPATEFWSRAPSCLAVGVGAAGVVVLAGQLSTRPVSVCAGIVYAILPRITWAGVEARSYAFAAMAAVWLTVLCVVGVRRNSVAVWVTYGVCVAVSTLLNVFVVLVVLAHAVVVVVVPCRRSAAGRWAGAAAAAVVVLIPFLVISRSQIAQVGWISTLNGHNVIDIVQRQYFDRSVSFAVLAGVVIATAIAGWLAGWWRPTAETRQLLMLCGGWIAVPTGVVVVYSAISEPIYYPRYLIVTAPAMAIVVAVCIVAVAGKPRPIAAVLLVFTVAAAPNYLLTQRGPHAKEGWDYSQVADVIGARAAPGDCLLVDNTTNWAPGPIRALLAARPAAFRQLVDVGRGTRGPQHGALWDGHVAVWLVTRQLNKCTTVWTITNRDQTVPAHQTGAALPPGPRFAHTPDFRALRMLRFRIVERWQFSFAQLIKCTRG